VKGKIMRLDKYLKVSRVIKRRTLANEVADAGRVLVNGKPAKASYTVKIGDIIEVTFGNRPVKIRVLSDVEQKGKDVAREMFEVIEG
jgi:ribosomal 50S subunit-recycling heat shock protein